MDLGTLPGVRTVLVAGASGTIGGRLARRLLADGHTVLVHGINEPRIDALVRLGATPVAALEAGAFGARRPDVVFNAAGHTGNQIARTPYIAPNIGVVARLIDLMRALGGGRLVQISSPSVVHRACDDFGIPEDRPFTAPVSPYAWSKQQAEQLLRAAPDIDWVVVRQRSIYGDGVPSMVERLRERIRAGRAVPLVRGGVVRIDLCHIDDAVDALIAAGLGAAGLRGATLNVAGPDSVSFAELVAAVAERDGRTPRILRLPAAPLVAGAWFAETVWRVLLPAGEPPMSRHAACALAYSQTLDLRRIITETGWAPRRRFSSAAL